MISNDILAHVLTYLFQVVSFRLLICLHKINISLYSLFEPHFLMNISSNRIELFLNIYWVSIQTLNTHALSKSTNKSSLNVSSILWIILFGHLHPKLFLFPVKKVKCGIQGDGSIFAFRQEDAFCRSLTITGY